MAADKEEQRNKALAQHAAQIRSHMVNLASKNYWQQFEKAPEFVVMFIPGESFFAAAVDVDRRLLEDAIEKRVVVSHAHHTDRSPSSRRLRLAPRTDRQECKGNQ